MVLNVPIDGDSVGMRLPFALAQNTLRAYAKHLAPRRKMKTTIFQGARYGHTWGYVFTKHSPLLLTKYQSVILKSGSHAIVFRLVIYKTFARHFLGLPQTHDVEDGRSDIGQDTVPHLCVLILRHIDEGNRVL